MATKRAAKPPKGYQVGDYPSFAVTVDIVILIVTQNQLEVLLIRRGEAPHRGAWALPGGFKRPDETLDQAAARELHEETGVDAARRLAQFRAYGDPGRDPRTNVVSIGYLAVLPEVGSITAGTDAAAAALIPVADVLDGTVKLAFDHFTIVRDAVDRARADLETTDLAAAFVPPEFTISELRNVYEALWGTRFDAANFRRSMLAEQALEPTGRRTPSGPEGGRPPELYRATAAFSASPPVRRPRKVDTDTEKRPRRAR